jgi:hypothetical protein
MNVVDTPDYAIASMATLVGLIGSQGSYAPTANQCYEMLEIEWQYVNYWFEGLLPNFATPLTASQEDVIKVKNNFTVTDPTVRFQRYEKQTQIGLPRSRSSTDLSFPGPLCLPGPYLASSVHTDGSTAVNFPSGLNTWLSTVSVDKAAFNIFSQVCETPACGNVHCADAIPTVLVDVPSLYSDRIAVFG